MEQPEGLSEFTVPYTDDGLVRPETYEFAYYCHSNKECALISHILTI